MNQEFPLQKGKDSVNSLNYSSRLPIFPLYFAAEITRREFLVFLHVVVVRGLEGVETPLLSSRWSPAPTLLRAQGHGPGWEWGMTGGAELAQPLVEQA